MIDSDDLALALQNSIVECTNDNKIGRSIFVPYLSNVKLQLVANFHDTRVSYTLHALAAARIKIWGIRRLNGVRSVVLRMSQGFRAWGTL